MKIIKDLEKSITESISMDKKSTFSSRLFNVLSLSFSVLTIILLLIVSFAFVFDRDNWLKVWMWIFYFVIAFIILGLYFAIIQRIRGKYLTATLSIWLSAFCILVMIILITVQLISHGKVFVFPFST